MHLQCFPQATGEKKGQRGNLMIKGPAGNLLPPPQNPPPQKPNRGDPRRYNNPAQPCCVANSHRLERGPGNLDNLPLSQEEPVDRAMNSVSSDRPSNTVDPKLLEILVCPLTKGPLEYDAEKQELISRSAKLAYPIRNGIPIMLPEEARRLD